MLRIFLLLIFAYVAYLALMFVMQRRMLFPRHFTPAASDPPQNIPGLKQIWVDTDFGRVESWLILPQSSTGGPYPVVIYAHGNGELIEYWPHELYPFVEMGVALLLVEYPGYGRSAGSPSQESIRMAFTAAYDDVTRRADIDASRVVLFGRSVGGGAVCLLAAARPSTAMILMSTFTSVRSFAGRYLAPSFLILDPFDNRAVVERYTGPILIIHGRHDRIVPYSHGVALHATARHSQMITYEAGHNSCPPSWSQFWRDVAGFLETTGIIPPRD
ncbi:MAG: alpha/beta hydrolase [Acidobacteria bacterium]|nr:alpha/beta hydrolase [Acidobacteriota bacterium]